MQNFPNLEILYKPVVLFHQQLYAVLHVPVSFSVDTDKVHWAHVETIKQIFRVSWHVEVISVVAEIAESVSLVNFFFHKNRGNFVQLGGLNNMYDYVCHTV